MQVNALFSCILLYTLLKVLCVIKSWKIKALHFHEPADQSTKSKVRGRKTKHRTQDSFLKAILFLTAAVLVKQANTWRGVHLDKIISETCREAQSVNKGKYVRNLQKRKNSEACNLYSILPPISAAWSNAIRCSQNSPCVAGCHLSKTSPHTGPRRNVVYKYKTKFPSSARWPQPKGLRWFGSWDRSAATVSDSGSILNRADRSWSAGRNWNQMWDLTTKTGSSEKPRGGGGTAINTIPEGGV